MRDSIYTQDMYCANGGLVVTKSTRKTDLQSIYPKEDQGVSLHFELFTQGHDQRSFFFIYQSKGAYNTFRMFYNPETNRFEKTHDFSKENVEYYNELKLGNSIIKNVHKFYMKSDSFYSGIDTIYYNPDIGLLKLVSRKHDVELVNKSIL